MAEPAGDDDRDRLRRLSDRLDVAAQRAERLLSETVRSAATPPDSQPPPPGHDHPPADPGRPPPSGWQRPRVADERRRERWLDGDELELLLGVVAGAADRIPPELRHRLADAVRELLIALRALIDWYLERTDRPARAAADVQDIPIV